MEKLLLTGLDNVVGANFALTLADRCEISALASVATAVPAGIEAVVCNHDDLADVIRCARKIAPQKLLHCGPLARSSWDLPAAPDFDVDREVRLIEALARVARETSARLTVISTDAVFCGPRLFHDESAPPLAMGPVADAARAVEQVLKGTGALLARSHVYGWGPAGTEWCLAEQIYTDLVEGRDTAVDAHRHATPILASDLAELTYRAWSVGLQGIYHFAGAERTSRFRFAAELAVACGLPGRQVQLDSTCQLRLGQIAEETSLNTRLARVKLSMPLPMLREGLGRFADQAENGYRARIQAMCCPAERHAMAA